MAFVRKIKASLVREDVDDYISESTYLFYDIVTGSLRIHNGNPGGVVIAGPGFEAGAATNVVSTNYTLLVSDDVVMVDVAGSVMSLPDATSFPSPKKYTIKNLSTGSIIVSPYGSQTIDGQDQILITQQYTSITITTDLSNWFII